MAVKKYILGFIFIAFMLMSYLYLSNKYNLYTVEYAFTGNLSYKQLVDLRESTKTLVKIDSKNKGLICVVNYIGSFKGNRLIMTTGFDNLVKNIPMVKGNFISDNQIKEAVLGDKAADRLYSSINVVGQTIDIQNQEYKITGVIKNSDEIYITFDDHSNISWSKKNIKFIIENQKYLYLYTEMIVGKLRTLDLDVMNPVIYKQEAYLYINVMLLGIVIFLFRTMKKHMIKTSHISREIYGDYIQQSRSIEIINYFRKNIKSVIGVIKELLLSAIYFMMTIRCISYFQIPLGLIPNNLFALSSYVDVIEQNIDTLISRLNYGISGIALDVHIINSFILVAFIGTLFYLNVTRLSDIIADRLFYARTINGNEYIKKRYHLKR
jgi:hypothetical protein